MVTKERRSPRPSVAHLGGSGPFFVLTLGWSWLFYLALALSGLSLTSLAGMVLLGLGGMGPALAAITLTNLAQDANGRRDFWRRVVDVRRIHTVWYAVIVIVVPALNALAILMGFLLGAPLPSFERAAEYLVDPLALVQLAIFFLFFGPIPEDLGWRGYALDRLQARWSALAASLILGFFWVLWHWPRFFVTDSIIQTVFPFGTAVFWIGFVGWTLGSSVLYTWVHNNTGSSTLAAIMLHFMVNFTGEFLTVRDEFILYRTHLLVALAIAIVLIYGPATLTRRRSAQAASQPIGLTA